jgi:muramoyltetrapeptide carboxypeptidase
LRPWKIKKTGSLKTGRGRGRLIGGNLSLLVSLLSSPYFPDSEGAILLIEDRGEKLYRLDRMLTTLRLSGRLENLAGLLFGDFGPNIPLKALKPLLMETALACPGPTAFSPVFGHGPTNRPWPVGGLAELAVDQAGGSLTFLKPD